MTPFILVFYERLLEYLDSIKAGSLEHATGVAWLATLKLLESSFVVDDSGEML
jgi:hypothetical protein